MIMEVSYSRSNSKQGRMNIGLDAVERAISVFLPLSHLSSRTGFLNHLAAWQYLENNKIIELGRHALARCSRLSLLHIDKIIPPFPTSNLNQDLASQPNTPPYSNLTTQKI
jgi:hypothetical protein